MPAEDGSDELNIDYLSSLPNEMSLAILAKLSLSELMRLRATSRGFRTFITYDILKQLGHTLVNYCRQPSCQILGKLDSSILTLKIINPDIMVCGTEGGKIFIWNLHLNLCVRILQLRSAITVIERITDRFFLSGSESGVVRIWDLHTYQHQCMNKFMGQAQVSSMTLVSDNIMAIGFANGKLTFCNLESGIFCDNLLSDHPIWILKLCANNRIAAGCGDGFIRLINLHNHENKVLSTSSGPVMALTVSPDKSFLVSGSSFGYICVWNLETLTLVKRWKIKAPIWSVTATRNDLIMTGSHDGCIRVWDLHTGACINTIQTETKSVNIIATHPDEAKLICTCDDNSIRIYTFPSFPKPDGRAMLKSSL